MPAFAKQALVHHEWMVMPLFQHLSTLPCFFLCGKCLLWRLLLPVQMCIDRESAPCLPAHKKVVEPPRLAQLMPEPAAHIFELYLFDTSNYSFHCHPPLCFFFRLHKYTLSDLCFFESNLSVLNEHLFLLFHILHSYFFTFNVYRERKVTIYLTKDAVLLILIAFKHQTSFRYFHTTQGQTA